MKFDRLVFGIDLLDTCIVFCPKRPEVFNLTLDILIIQPVSLAVCNSKLHPTRLFRFFKVSHDHISRTQTAKTLQSAL